MAGIGKSAARCWAVGVAAAALTSGAASAAWGQPMGAPAAPPPQATGPVVETDSSHIYAPVALAGSKEAEALRKAGYVQREYFLSGAANLYAYGPDGRRRVEQAGLPYVTRLLVVAPTDPKRFSGTVHITAFHPSLGRNQWSRFSAYILRHGDAYVVVGTGGDEQQRRASTPDAPLAAPLIYKWFDPVRYAPIYWPQDDGIRWDVFAQTAALLKSDRSAAVLPGLKVDRLYASGWSFLGSFMRTFIDEGFHDGLRTAAGRAVIDGYLIGISSETQGGGYLPINSLTPAAPLGDAHRRLKAIDVPVIEVMSENEGLFNREPVRTAADSDRLLERTYELAGVTHTDLGFTPETEPAVAQLAARGHPGGAEDPPCPLDLSDVPMRDFAQAALANLDAWSRAGALPPQDARLEVAGVGVGVKDEAGNTRGGVRLAQLDLPLASYGPAPGGACKHSGFLVMRRSPLSAQTLKRLYPGGAKEYLARFKARLDQLVAGRWILPEDAAEELARARAYAARQF